MLYFKHSQLANDYHVSLKTVHNWIDAAKQSKLDLQLHERNGRTYVANTPGNVAILERLADQGKKYRNTLHHKVVTPKPEFYKTYSRRQIHDIISNLKIHHEIPQQYNYFDVGAVDWDNWLHRLNDDPTSNILKGTIGLLDANMSAIDRIIEDYERVNIVDVGAGNALPVKGMLAHLAEKNILNRYIAIDISQNMLKIAEQNVKTWLKKKVQFEGYVRDISYERFDDLLVDDMLQNKAKTINIILFFGGTRTNFRSPTDVMKVVYGSMNENDLLIYADKPDTEASRRYFDLNSKPSKNSSLSPFYSLALGLLGVEESLFEVERGFNEQKRMRFVRIRLRSALTIKLIFDDAEYDVIFEKGDTILLLRMWHQNVLEIISEFDEIGFTLLHSSLTNDRQYLLTISGVSTDKY